MTSRDGEGAPLTPPPTPPHTSLRLPSSPGLPTRRTSPPSTTRKHSEDSHFAVQQQSYFHHHAQCSLSHSESSSSTSSSGSQSPRPPLGLPLSPAASFGAGLAAGSATRPPRSPSGKAFDAGAAAARCREMPGYVSFGDVEGLGVPEDLDGEQDEDEDERRGREGKVKEGLLKLIGWARRRGSA